MDCAVAANASRFESNDDEQRKNDEIEQTRRRFEDFQLSTRKRTRSVRVKMKLCREPTTRRVEISRKRQFDSRSLSESFANSDRIFADRTFLRRRGFTIRTNVNSLHSITLSSDLTLETSLRLPTFSPTILRRFREGVRLRRDSRIARRVGALERQTQIIWLRKIRVYT